MKTEIFNNHFQNFKSYQIPKAQLIIADIPYNLGVNAYASNPAWYKDGDNANGESELAGKEFFDTDKNFKPAISNKVKMGTNMMVTYELIIPLPDGFTLEKMQIILDKLQGCLDKTKIELPDIRNNIRAIDGHIKLVIWYK